MDSYICQYCGRVCKNSNSLKNHERLCRNNPNKDLNSYEKARLRGEKFNPFKNRKIVHKIGEETAHDEYQYRCSICNRYFTKYGIGSHVYICRKSHNLSKEDEFFKIRNSDTLDVTYREIEEYRQKTPKCEICGRTVDEASKYKGKFAAKRLCVDHDHITKKFRGLLCTQCNRALGWYENNKDRIEEYLNKGSLV